MALIKCPECGKEISDTCDVCIHCGYKLQTKKKSSLKWKWDKKISIVIIAIIIIGIVASIIFFNKYQYKRDGFVGLDKKLTLEMQPDELDSLKIYGKLAAKDYDSLYTYENIKLFEKYTGDMNISLENNDYSKINSLYFTFAGHPNSKDIIKGITAKVGEPVHKDNYNDQRYDKAYILWKLDKKHYLSYVYTFKDETAELRCGYFDIKQQEELKKCEVNLKKDKTLKKEYDKINARVKFTDLSMEDLKKKFKIKYDNSAENYSSFKERATLFGHKGYFKYYVKNPNEDDYDSDFIGQICFEEFRFDKLTKKDEKEIISQLKRMYGKGIKDTYTVRSWYDSYSRCTAEKIGDEFYLRFSRNFQYCFINPKFNSTDSTKKILAYGDCNEKMFKFEKEEGYKRVTNISTIDTCWKLAQEEILSQLKSPSSAQFGSAAPASSDVRVTRYNDEYYVESWVDAENSFGATIRTNFEVTLRKNGRSFEVESSRIY